MNIETVPDQAAHRVRTLLTGLVCLLGAAPVLAATTAPDRGQLERLARVRVPFVENRGQLDHQVAFSARTFFGTVFVTREGKLVYSLPPAAGKDREAGKGRSRPEGWTLTETLVSGKSRPTAGARAVTRVSYFQGNDPRGWQSDLPTYEEVHLGEVWRGVAVLLRAHGGNVEKVFALRSGARVTRIRVRLRGARSLRIDADGALVAATGNGDIRYSRPVAYQERDGQRWSVAASYVLRGQNYGFCLGRYDKSLPVIIDPVLQATYLGGSGGDSTGRIAVNSSTGEIYLSGETISTDFPGTTGGAQPNLSPPGQDVYIARLNSTLTTVLQATYLGGSSLEFATGIAVQPSNGEIFVAGYTLSDNFPSTDGSLQPSRFSLTFDGFVARLDPTLTVLRQATYLGGTFEDYIVNISVDPSTGDLLVVGATFSTDFPGTEGGAQSEASGSLDGLVARLDSSLTTLLQATYVGGSDVEWMTSIAVHPTTGELFVSGTTQSDDFPGTAGGAQAALNGVNDGVIARLDPTLATVLQATYLGGNDVEAVRGIAIHPTSGEVFVAGETASNDFPVTAGGAQSVIASLYGFPDGFVARLTPTLATLLQSTYVGGIDGDVILGIAIHPSSGEILLAGGGSFDFPGTAGGAQPGFRGVATYSDELAVRLDSTLTTLLQATHLGGSEGDIAGAIAVHPTTGEVLVAGHSRSTDFPNVAGGGQSSPAGDGDAFLVRLTADLAAIVTPRSLLVDSVAIAPSRAATSDGNGVLEAEESVTIRPSWRNPGSIGQSATGTATFSGLFVATYSIHDATADYDSIDPGGTASCESDCYEVSVSAVSHRPVHFDALLVESLSTRDFEFWDLHVGESFTDVPRSHLFYRKIESLLHHSVTSGCNRTNYCPDDPVTRDQMSLFLARILAGGGRYVPESGTVGQSPYVCLGGISLFSDVAPTSFYCKHVHYLAAQSVTQGCGADLYCPTSNISRGEMAIFVSRALFAPAGGATIPTSYGPDPVTGFSYSCDAGGPILHFTDISASDSFCKHVHYLWAKGVVSGCSATEYCPAEIVSRGAMARFLANAFRLELYGP